MKKSVGNIEYNDDAALNYGGNIKDEINTDTDICMYVKESDDYKPYFISGKISRC